MGNSVEQCEKVSMPTDNVGHLLIEMYQWGKV